MNPILEPLIVDFVAWIAREPRSYGEALEAWRTSCPRLTVWEDAYDRGLVASRRTPDRRLIVEATGAGKSLLRAHGR